MQIDGKINTSSIQSSTANIGTTIVSGLTSTGNVGIGTSGSSYKLSISPSSANTPGINLIMGRNSSNGDYGSLAFGDPNGTTIYNEIRSIRNATSSSYDLALYYDNWGAGIAEGMRISANGYVGIGTSNPGTKLDVNGNINASSIQTTTANIGATTVSGLTSTGNVGIGTSGSSYKLSISPSSANTPGINLLMGRNSSNGDYGSLAFGDPDGATIYNEIRSIRNATYNSYDLAFYYRNWGANISEGMRISRSGNVGIGTTIPGAKLEVSGGDISVSSNGKGIILKSQNGTTKTLYLKDDGTIGLQ